MAEQVPSPNACRWCGIDKDTHYQQWSSEVKWHLWVEPTPEQRKERMLKRTAAS
ncbi:hypothetical protein ACFXG4_04020 [Nocardia sp. NPDC059246]|uniref:hypothetical protein n=1 Tax=unclassified Nocardia TaxID=2637762 RepID=UPI00368FA215